MEPFNAGWLSLLPPAAAIVAFCFACRHFYRSGYLHKLYRGEASSSAVWMLFFR